MSVVRYGPVPIAALRTDEGLQAILRALFPGAPALHAMTVADFDAITGAAKPFDGSFLKRSDR